MFEHSCRESGRVRYFTPSLDCSLDYFKDKFQLVKTFHEMSVDKKLQVLQFRTLPGSGIGSGH